jgi:hypothetical protein
MAVMDTGDAASTIAATTRDAWLQGVRSTAAWAKSIPWAECAVWADFAAAWAGSMVALRADIAKPNSITQRWLPGVTPGGHFSFTASIKLLPTPASQHQTTER